MTESAIRTKSFRFAVRIVDLTRRLQAKREFVVSHQLLKAGTSIGANVEEAQAGQSKRDFLAKMAIASKEAREAKYWLRLIRETRLGGVDVSEELDAVEELIRILTAIVKSSRE
jgi:four helix bundle protein